MRRHKLARKKSKRMFSKHSGTHGKNHGHRIMRGGIRL